MKSLVVLWNHLAQELGEWLCIDTIRDQTTVAARSNMEGTSFLTITLPQFGSDFVRCLADGYVDPTAFAGFQRTGGLPRFLGGFLDLVFDRKSGILLDDPNLTAIFAIRQLTGVFKKILIPCSSQRIEKAYAKFIETEQTLQQKEREWTQADYLAFSRVSNLLFGRVFSECNDLVAQGRLLPKHGPGSTADRLLGNQKFDLKLWTWRLEQVFPSSDYLIPSARYYKELEAIEFVHPEQELPVRVTAVPKTLKTPRLIAIEPTCMQYAQQAVARSLTELVHRDDIAQRFITLPVQEHNQFLARIGSITMELATLDLSEASDRVSNQLVKFMLHGYTDLSEAVQASRSLRADVPGYGVIPLTKFASMGSALTFPVECMVFLTLCFLGIEKRLGRRLTLKDVIEHTGKVRVYGDDLIVPTTDADAVTETLHHYGFKVNVNKSFSRGNFRESCGKEYFRGTDVSIIKCGREFPESSAGQFKVPVNDLSGEEIRRLISLVKFRNNLYKRGLRSTCDFLDLMVRRVLPYFPDGLEGSPGLVRVVEGPCMYFDTWDHELHVGKVKAYVPRFKKRKTPLNGIGALLKYFLKEGVEPFQEKDHLDQSGRPVAVKLKLRNVKPY